jgi:hypothetical protein
LQIHTFPTGRAARTFSRQELRQSISAHGCTPSKLRLYFNVSDVWRLYGVRLEL